MNSQPSGVQVKVQPTEPPSQGCFHWFFKSGRNRRNKTDGQKGQLKGFFELGKTLWLVGDTKAKKASMENKWDNALHPPAAWIWVAHVAKIKNSPGWCGSVNWAPAYEWKSPRFDSQSGQHMPGLRARPPVRGVWEATNRFSHTWMFPSFSLPPFPSL